MNNSGMSTMEIVLIIGIIVLLAIIGTSFWFGTYP